MTALHNLVMIPGIGCTGEMFRYQMDSLSDVARCWAAPLYPREDLKEIAAEILDSCPFDTFSVTGASMGGYLCFELYRLAPERIVAMAPMVTRSKPDPDELREKRQKMNHDIISGRWGAMWHAIVRKCLARSNRNDSRLVREVVKHVTATSPSVFLMHHKALGDRDGYDGLLEDLSCEVTIIAGIEDEVITLAEQADMQARIPNSRLMALRSCGHLPTFEQPQRCSDTLRWWLSGLGMQVAA